MKIFHHNDLDGRCAGAIAFQHYPAAECIEINYNQPFPMESIKDGEIVCILDYSVEPEEILKLLTKGCNVTWIDHHKTALEKYHHFPRPIAGYRNTERSSAWLAWEYFNPKIDVPLVVRLVDDWDMWTHETNPNGRRTRDFVEGMKMQRGGKSPRTALWAELLDSDDFTERKARDGAVASLYSEVQNEEYLQAFGHPIQFEGHNCYACNRGMTNSKLFDSIANVPYEIFIPFVWDGKKWTVSLYSKTVDVSEIAKKHGGGGHKGAAGFVCDRLPWGDGA